MRVSAQILGGRPHSPVGVHSVFDETCPRPPAVSEAPHYTINHRAKLRRRRLN